LSDNHFIHTTMRVYTRLQWGFFFLLMTSLHLQAQVQLCLRPNAAQGKDAVISDWTPVQNFGIHPEYAGISWTCNGAPCLERGFIEFDLTSIPAGSLVNTARFSLFANPNPLNGNGYATQGNNAAWIERITGTWNESTINWNNAPTTTAINRVYLPTSSGYYQNYVVDVRDLVQDMVDDPANSHGFSIRLDNEFGYTSMIFASSDYADSAYRPMLEVNYTPPGAQQCQTVLVTDGNGQDAAVTSFAPTTPYPNHEEFGGIAWTCNGNPCWQHGLMQFDLSFILTTATIDSAFLDLHANLAGQVMPPMQGMDASHLRRITSSWNAATVTWNTEPTYSNQNAIALPAATNGYQDYLHWDVLPLVRDMVANPSSSFGFEIELDNPVYYTAMVFASSDYPTSSLHPSLKVCYRLASSVDELSGSVRGLELYPNPAVGAATVELRLVAPSVIRWELLDVMGRIHSRSDEGLLAPGDHRIRVPLNDPSISDGMYWLRIFSSDRTISRKLQVLH
jgi:hypothetical protein